MSSRVAKPGGSKFRPARPQPKKTAHPAAVAASAAATESSTQTPSDGLPASNASAVFTSSAAPPASDNHGGLNKAIGGVAQQQGAEDADTEVVSSLGASASPLLSLPISTDITEGGLELADTQPLGESGESGSPPPVGRGKAIVLDPPSALENYHVPTPSARNPTHAVSGSSAGPARSSPGLCNDASPPQRERRSLDAEHAVFQSPESTFATTSSSDQRVSSIASLLNPEPNLGDIIRAKLAVAPAQEATEAAQTSSPLQPTRAAPDGTDNTSSTDIPHRLPISGSTLAAASRSSLVTPPGSQNLDVPSGPDPHEAAEGHSPSTRSHDFDSSTSLIRRFEEESRKVIPEEEGGSTQPNTPAIILCKTASSRQGKRMGKVTPTATVGRKRKRPMSASEDGRNHSALPEPSDPWTVRKGSDAAYVVSTLDILSAMELPTPEDPELTNAQAISMVSNSSARARRRLDSQAAVSSRPEDSEGPSPGREFTEDLIDPALLDSTPLGAPQSELDAHAVGSAGNLEQEEQEQEEDSEGSDVDKDDRATHTAHDDPRAALDPTTTTMKSLVKNDQRGRLSSWMVNRLKSKNDKRSRIKLARERMKLQLALERRGLAQDAIKQRLEVEFAAARRSQQPDDIRELDNDEQDVHSLADAADDDVDAHSAVAGEGSTSTGARHTATATGGNDDDEDGLVESQFAPQMMMVDGEYVLNEDTLHVEQGANFADYAVIEEGPGDRKINSATYGKRIKPLKWTSADTELFYDGLRQFGTDFELISHMFVGRTRRQIKLKWVREEKANPERITEALTPAARKNIDIQYYESMTSIDLTNGQVPADPMTRFYEDLPTIGDIIPLDSNRVVDDDSADKAEADGPDLGAGAADEEQEDDQDSTADSQRIGDGPLFNPPSDDERVEGDDEHGEDDAVPSEFSDFRQGQGQAEAPTEEAFDFAALGGIQLRTSN